LIKHCDDFPTFTRIGAVIFCPIQKLVLISVIKPGISIRSLITDARKRKETVKEAVEKLQGDTSRIVQILSS
jgi:hypothetical protein